MFSFSTILTKFGWMEGTPEEISQRIKACQKLEDEQKDNLLDSFNQLLELCVDEVVNGYPLGMKSIRFSKEAYQELIDIWLVDQNIEGFEHFYHRCKREMCTDWCKQDEFGDDFGGFWESPKCSDEYKNAFDWTQKKNIMKLYQLPYPTEILFRSIILGCRNRIESVAFSNFYGYYLEKKYAEMNPGEALPRRDVKFPIGFNEDDFIRNGYSTSDSSSESEESN